MARARHCATVLFCTPRHHRGPTIVLDDDLRSVVSVSVQRTKVSSFDPHLMSV
jgi:hypothetical protein